MIYIKKSGMHKICQLRLISVHGGKDTVYLSDLGNISDKLYKYI